MVSLQSVDEMSANLSVCRTFFFNNADFRVYTSSACMFPFTSTPPLSVLTPSLPLPFHTPRNRHADPPVG